MQHVKTHYYDMETLVHGGTINDLHKTYYFPMEYPVRILYSNVKYFVTGHKYLKWDLYWSNQSFNTLCMLCH